MTVFHKTVFCARDHHFLKMVTYPIVTILQNGNFEHTNMGEILTSAVSTVIKVTMLS